MELVDEVGQGAVFREGSGMNARDRKWPQLKRRAGRGVVEREAEVFKEPGQPEDRSLLLDGQGGGVEPDQRIGEVAVLLIIGEEERDLTWRREEQRHGVAARAARRMMAKGSREQPKPVITPVSRTT